MIAYNKYWLNNLLISRDLNEAVCKNLLKESDKISIEHKYPVGFYTPNYFTRIGLFILTIIIAGFTIGLVTLSNNGNEKFFGQLLIFFSVLTYIVLELLVKYLNHYKSGIDDALLWLTGLGFISGLNLINEQSLLVNICIIFLMALYFFFRFATALMGVISAITFLLASYLLYIKLGDLFIATGNFFVLLLGVGIYMYSIKLYNSKSLTNYKNGFKLIEITALICIYAVVNYYVVKEEIFDIINQDLSIPFKIEFVWLYWLFTIIIPILYLLKGLQKKDRILLRIGMLYILLMIVTIVYFFPIIPVEITLTIGGILLIATAFLLIKYLHKPQNGFAYDEIADKNAHKDAEALIITESFSGTETAGQNAAVDGRAFGGGSFGGGGASGDF